ncbi:class I SAM-dependent methyltransferase [Micromonospora cathayae]|uniref:Class I SAM-dependent methyltransferase n=1 Tax=Micromonospora cathayae TaxID=3028804 RepID=A0ABY7ZMA9_9ACTN|nr:class I SAM-dependent methyltransferase [Micromonospora sp. HUAS 3]WDZ83576.1 class I SAM-dependent methyltransferase [Micromonospora sp. HUAS 3]
MTSTALTPVAEFTDAPGDAVESSYRKLVRGLWDDGRLTEAALPTVPELVRALGTVGRDRRGHLAVLLGLLAEVEPEQDARPVHEAVRAGLAGYLDQLAAATDDYPFRLALLYLLAHFPADAAAIRPVVAGLRLDEDDLTRLERCLQQLDPDAPDLGRVWPAPSAWSLTEAERALDRKWISQLTPEQVRITWRNDTDSLLGYAGAKARWAVGNGDPVQLPGTVDTVPAGPAAPAGAPRHLAVLRCPVCRSGGLTADTGTDTGTVRCTDCATRYGMRNGCLDLSAGIDEKTTTVVADVLQESAVLENIAISYESRIRPAFLRVMGGNWSGGVTPVDEDRYLDDHVRPVDGPVLDLAAGSGRWTEVLARRFGADRVIGLDVNMSMLSCLRRRLPDVLAVRASALALPFADASLGAVNCWNALQALPDAAEAIAEVGRCLRPGGTFTVMTFRPSEDPVYAHFQMLHRFPSRPQQLLLFPPELIEGWLAAAGLTVRHRGGSGTFVFLTAVRGADRGE